MNQDKTRMNLSPWESRSRTFGCEYRSVLFKSLPDVLNEYVHRWHVSQVLQGVSDLDRKTSIRILDIGCGYGRISGEIRDRFSDARIYGMDISRNYVKMFEKYVGRSNGLVGDVRALPFKKDGFDCVIAVTTLMYLSKDNLHAVLREIFRTLRRTGKLVLIENNRRGEDIFTLFGMVTKVQRFLSRDDLAVQTGGHAFDHSEIQKAINELDGRILDRRGFPAFTFGILPLFIVSKINGKVLNVMLYVCQRLDKYLEDKPMFSKHILYIVQKL